jgi:aspartate ammonia-lyase
MPGKVNPSMPEMANMACFQVIGNDTTIAWAVGGGQLELNVMMPIMVHNMLQSLHVMGMTLRQMTDLCISGIVANKARCKDYAERSLGLATALNVYIGYKDAAAVAKEAASSHRTVIEVIRERKLLTDAQIKKIMDPIAMTIPGIPGKGGG